MPMTQILETNRLSLKYLTFEDAPFIVELLNDSDFIKNIGDRGVRDNKSAVTYLKNGPLQSYAKNGFGIYLVIKKETQEPIGICGLIKRETLNDVDIGYAYLPKYRGMGYAVEAAQVVLNYGIHTLKLNRIVAITIPENKGSIKVLEKIGLQFKEMIQLEGDDSPIMLFATNE